MTENHSVIMFFDLCRLCLTNKGSIDIFDQAGLQNDITICIGIQIIFSDNLPRQVCSSCWDIVKKAMELRLIATKNNYHLNSLFEDETENCEISICEALVEKLVKLEADGPEQVNINVTVESSIVNNSKEQPTPNISVRKDLFNEPQPTPEVDKPKKAKKRHKEKIKPRDEDKKEQNDSDSSTECDTTQTETKVVKKEKKKRKKLMKKPTPNILVQKDLLKEPQSTPEVDKPKKAKKRHKEKIKSQDEDKKEQNNSDSSTECDTTQTETKAVKKENKKRKSSQDDEDQVFNCEECSKTFETHKKLYLHRRLHNKTFVCPLIPCRKKFATKGDLEKHVRIHTGDKPFKCDICEKTFSQKVTLRGHLNLVHNKAKG